jgi:SAM-dependent methyltransferase
MPVSHESPDSGYVPAYDRRGWLAEDPQRHEHPKFAQQILQTISPLLDKPASQLCVLDVGSGYGGTARQLARTCRQVVGIELSAERVADARNLAASAGLSNVQFRCQSVYDLEEIDAYDLAVMDNVLEHLPDQRAALAAVSGALRPGGLLYLLVPNKLWPIEVHYRLPFLSYLPRRWANWYLRASGRGTDYTDASYAPTYFGLRRLLEERTELAYEFVLPANIELAAGGARWHYRWGVRAIRICPGLWAISKAFLVVATKVAVTSRVKNARSLTT